MNSASVYAGAAGRDGEGPVSSAGELLADTVPEAARLQASWGPGGRKEHGSTGKKDKCSFWYFKNVLGYRCNFLTLDYFYNAYIFISDTRKLLGHKVRYLYT